MSQDSGSVNFVRKPGDSPLSSASHETQLYLGVAFATVLGHAPLTALPFVVAAIGAGLHLTSSQLGYVATAELTSYALTAILISFAISRWSPRSVALIGCTLAIAANLFAAFTQSIPLFVFACAVAGCGSGLIFSCANSAGARARSPERVYSVGMGVSIVFTTMLPSVLAHAMNVTRLGPVHLFAHSGVFLAMTAFTIALLATTLFLPAQPSGVHTPDAALRPARAFGLAGIGALAVMALFSIGDFSVWTFMVRRGEALGMTHGQVGDMTSAAVALGVIGTIASTVLGRRIGIAAPLVLGLTLEGLSCAAVTASPSPTALWAASIAYLSVWYFVYPYIMGFGALIDRQGRLGTALGAAYLVGSSIAATLGGLLIEHGGFLLMGLISFGLCITAATLVFVMRAVAADAHRSAPVRNPGAPQAQA